MNSRTKALKEIEDEVLGLRGSFLAEERIKNSAFPVVGEGSDRAEIMFVGEAPGANEAKTGKPFIGRSGKFLDELLISVDISRESVYITSIVKDRPPKNRDPKPEEIELYAPFLDRQIKIIKPKVIATLGRFAMAYIMNRYGLAEDIRPISAIHGKIFKAKMQWGEVSVVTLFHPSVAIYNQHSKGLLFEDFKILKTLI